MKKVLFNKYTGLFALIGCDALSKAIALLFIPSYRGLSYPFGGIGVFENLFGINFSLNVVTNTGVAWGLFPGHLFALLGLRIAIIGALLFYLFFFNRRAPFALWMIAAGAIGNVIDMICYGHVIDFFHFQLFGWTFPIFNVADSLITIGVLLLFLLPKQKPAFHE